MELIYVFITLTLVTFTVYSDLFEDDTFICKKVSKRNSYGEFCFKERDRLRALEEQVSLLKQRQLEQLETLGIPPVLKLQQSAIPHDCSALFEAGETTDGIYQISPDGRCAFDVYCDMQNGGWTVIQRRKHGSTDFQRDWLGYVNGFGDLQGDFWLGLEKIHRLTTGGSQIYFTLGHYNSSLQNDWAYYESFAVSDTLTGYRMDVDHLGYKGSIKELLSYHNGQKFSTMDRDNDLFSHSCSTQYGGNGGWWYQSCYRLGILNGFYGVKGTGGISIWQDGPRYIKDTEIKVKPRLGQC